MSESLRSRTPSRLICSGSETARGARANREPSQTVHQKTGETTRYVLTTYDAGSLLKPAFRVRALTRCYTRRFALAKGFAVRDFLPLVCNLDARRPSQAASADFFAVIFPRSS